MSEPEIDPAFASSEAPAGDSGAAARGLVLGAEALRLGSFVLKSGLVLNGAALFLLALSAVLVLDMENAGDIVDNASAAMRGFLSGIFAGGFSCAAAAARGALAASILNVAAAGRQGSRRAALLFRVATLVALGLCVAAYIFFAFGVHEILLMLRDATLSLEGDYTA